MTPLYYIEDIYGFPYLTVIEDRETDGIITYQRLRSEGDRPVGSYGKMNRAHLQYLIFRGVADVTHIGAKL